VFGTINDTYISVLFPIKNLFYIRSKYNYLEYEYFNLKYKHAERIYILEETTLSNVTQLKLFPNELYSKIGGDSFWLKERSVVCIMMSDVCLIEVLLWNTYPSFAW